MRLAFSGKWRTFFLAATIDRHPNVSIERLDHTEANLGHAVVQVPPGASTQHVGELLRTASSQCHFSWSIQLQQVVEHRACS